MKASETKSVATSAKTDSPFFNKGTDTGLLNDNATETAFFDKQNDSSFFVQAKLTVGQPNDKYEQEADTMADKVVQRLDRQDTKAPGIQTRPADLIYGISPFVQTKCDACEQEEKKEKKTVKEEVRRKPIFESNAEPQEDKGAVQRKCSACEEKEKHVHLKEQDNTHGADMSAIEGSLSASKGSGKALPEQTRLEMENSFGADFSAVRIHDNSNAVQMNEGLNAQAFAHGNDIYFNSGKYNPETASGKHLLAHELTHTVQQGGSAVRKKDQEKEPEIKTDQATPNIQASWYNFNIPFTDYQFDPSIDGLKNAGNMAVDAAKWTGGKVKDGAVWVKDTVVDAFQWVYDKIAGFVNEGMEWLGEKYAEIRKFAESPFEAIKSALSGVLGFITAPLSIIQAAFANMDGDVLQTAWSLLTSGANAVLSAITSVTRAVLKMGAAIWAPVAGFITSIFNKIDAVINSRVFGYVPDFLQQKARQIYNGLRSLWITIRDFWTALWKKLTAYIEKILASIKSFVNKVLAYAIQGVIKIMKSLKAAYDLVKLVAKDPEAFIKPILENLAAKLNAEAPPKAKEMARQKLKENVPAKGADSTGNGVIQKAPTGTTATAKPVRSTATYTEIDKGIDRSITQQWNDLKLVDMLWQTIKNMFWPPATIKAIGHEFYELWTDDWTNAAASLFAPRNILDDPLGFFHDIWSDFLILLDFPLALWRRLNNILMLLMGYVTIILVVIGFVGGAAVGGGVGGLPGAAAGLAMAGALGEGLMVSFLLAEGITIVKALLDLFTARQTANDKERDYKQIAGSAIGIGIALVLEMLFAFLSSLVSEIVGRIKGKPGASVPEPSVKSGEGPKPGEPVEPKPVDGEGGKGTDGEGGKTTEPKAVEGETSPSMDGQRELRINEQGKCEVCASPCADIRAKYKEEITPEINKKISAVEADTSLTEAAKKDLLKPIEQELADLKGKVDPGSVKGISVGDEITLPRKGGRTRGKVVGMDEKYVKVKYDSGSGKGGEVTQSIPREKFEQMVIDGEIVPADGIYKYLIENRPKYREGLVNEVWEAAKAQGNGKVIDPLTKKELTWDRTKPRTEQWDMGHKYGHEYRELVKRRANGEITHEQFLDEYNNPKNYQPEDPMSNQSHAGEKK
ncbi:DUF4157 domain-containing protein [Pedobacter sp. WC2423]|uniref:eCIS core domain-containing protein n=1 Tax=Pedobacter sp. WC2423 TaxID=3234142 RepID=UPI003467844E